MYNAKDSSEYLRIIDQAIDDGWEDLRIVIGSRFLGKLTEEEHTVILGTEEKPYLIDVDLFRQLTRVTSLRSLNISGNELVALPPYLGKLRQLEHLDASNNIINFIPDEIQELPQLKHLILWKNRLTVLPPSVTKLKTLSTLVLGRNHLSSLPPEIGKLTNLKYLNLGTNYLPAQERSFYNRLSKMSEIREKQGWGTTFFLGSNQINFLPKEIEDLVQLEKLELGSIGLKELPDCISRLTKLIELDVNFNEITDLPPNLNRLSTLQVLDLRGNPISIPPEVLEKTDDPKSIINYYFSVIKQQAKPINEIKLLFIGQGSVGKTSLIRRLLHDNFKVDEHKTEGITISKWKTLDDIHLNLWDFGGQEVMHATHQFFLTKRSLYLLVLDSRLTQEENRVEYWLKIIQSFGGESPVLIIGNKIDQHPLDIDRTGLQKKYPNIVGILETSAATGAGIEELKAAITEQVNNLPHVRDLLPETWFTVKTKLEELGKQSNFITHDKYLDLCTENEVSDETSQRTLIGFLHDLGVVLHFQDDPRLEALGILNPQWVTNGVYKILNSHTLFQNKGVLTVSMLDEILNLPDYPRGKRLFIVDMMKKFELCYDIEPDKTFLVPDLLPKDQPELKFNGNPAFEYAYPVLPSSVITRFIVRMNQKIDDGFIWRTGVLLKIGENTALVKADIEDRKITIAIDGLEHTRRDALLAVCTHLDEIHDSIKGLNPEKLIPVPGAVNAKPLSYNYLLMLEAKGVEILPVPDGNRLIDVNIRKVLSGVPNEIRPKESAGSVTNYYIAGDGGIVVGGNATGNNLVTGNYNKINSAEIDSELKDALLQLGEAVDAMIQKLPAEQAAEVAEDFGKLADEAVKPKPNKRWYSVSIEGLIKAAENLDKLGTPVINLSRKVLSILISDVKK